MIPKISHFAGAGAMALLLVGAAPAKAADVQIQFATTASGDHINIQIADAIKADIEKAVPGKVNFQLFPGGQLGKQKAVMTGLQRGTHIMSLQASTMPAVVPAFGVFDAPFLFGSREEVKAALSGPLGDRMKADAAKKGLRVLAIGELGFRQISNNVRPIVKPADLNGVKLRTPGNPFRIQVFKTFGANPTPMSFSEVYVALRSGVIDGQENPLGSIWGGKFHEVQNFISLSNHIFTPNAIVVSNVHWEKWPNDVKAAVQEAANNAAELSFKLGAEKDANLVGKMQAANSDLKVNDIDIAAFKSYAAPLHDEIRKKVGDEIWGLLKASM